MAMPGMDMIAYIRRYANYLNEKRDAYKIMGFDFCKIKRGKDDGLLRLMPAEKLLRTLPVLQKQLDALLQFDVTSNELANGILNCCFFLLIKDLIRLYAAFNDGMINLLEKYFDMNKKQCREGLDTYRKFIDRTDKVSTFLKLAETSGIEHNEIPDLSRAPSSLLEALENHLAHIEGKKISSQSLVSKHQTEQDLKNFSQDFVVNDSDDPQKILEEEAKALAHFNKAKESSSPPPPPPVVAPSTKPSTMKNGSRLAGDELLTDDLFSITTPASQPMPYTTHNVFDTTVPKSNFFEDILQPTSLSTNKNISAVPLVSNNQNIPPAAKLLQSGDLNSSLNHLFEHLDMKDRSKIGKDHQWSSADAKNQPKIGIGAGMVNTPGTTWSGSSSLNGTFSNMGLQSGGTWSQTPLSMPINASTGPNGLTQMNLAGMNNRSTSSSTNPFASHAPYHPQ